MTEPVPNLAEVVREFLQAYMDRALPELERRLEARIDARLAEWLAVRNIKPGRARRVEIEVGEPKEAASGS